MVVVEVCVESLAGVRTAARAGAQRVELCCALAAGGLTPSSSALSAALAVSGPEVVALVRPRAGDFLYSEEEFELLEQMLLEVRAQGAAGVALGCLTAEGEIDEARSAHLIERARPLAVTFHRAFDFVRDPLQALETLVRLGVTRILSSGQAPSAFEGRARLAELVRAARGRVTLVAAGGVRAHNVRAIVQASGVREVHFSASVARASGMSFHNPRPRLTAAEHRLDEGTYFETDEGRVRAMLASVRDPL